MLIVDAIGEKFYDLKDEIKSVETLRVYADRLMKDVLPEIQTQQKSRARGGWCGEAQQGILAGINWLNDNPQTPN